MVSMPYAPAKNKGWGVFFCKRFQSAALCSALILLPVVCTCAQVALETDAPRYRRTQTLSLTLINGLDEEIFSAAAGSDPSAGLINFEKQKNQWVWDALKLRCPRLECPQAAAREPDLGRLPPGQRCTISWKPAVYAAQTFQLPDPGVYRLTVLYRKNGAADGRKPVWATVKSNPFVLE